jgi:hypothetical protein
MIPELYVRKDVKGLPRKKPDFGIGIVGIVSSRRLVTTSDVQHSVSVGPILFFAKPSSPVGSSVRV